MTVVTTTSLRLANWPVAAVSTMDDVLGDLGIENSATELDTMTSEAITHVDDIGNDRVCMQQLIDGQITSYAGEKRYCHAGGASSGPV
jgi:hypothetical protein